MTKILLSSEAHRWIKRKIVSLEYPIGSQLLEKDICEELGIGRTPVREALQRLAMEKLVRIIPRKGVFVSDINAWELAQLFEARCMFELYCVQRVALTAHQVDIDRLRHLLKQAPCFAAEKRIEELVDIDRRFHMGLMKMLGNSFILEMADTIYDQLARTWYLSFSRRTAEEIHDTILEHLAILSALEKKEPNLAEKAVISHINHFRNKVLSGSTGGVPYSLS